MPIVNAREMMLEAASGGYAIGAFNVTNLIQIEGVVDAAVDSRSPIILQTSVMTSQFLGANVLAAVFRAIGAAAPVPICLHLNHGSQVEYCNKCADAGYTSIMIDASMQDFDDNVRQTCQVVQYCHDDKHVSVEGGLGHVANADGPTGEPQLANPRQAAQYVEQTGVDMFAPAIGTAHGVYKTRNPEVDFERMAEINRMLNGSGVKTPLVVHGGTGLSVQYIQRLIEVGGAKFNISTEFKRTLIDAQFEYMTANRQEYEPGKIDVVGRDATRKAAGRWIQLLGSAGRA